ncbi:FadR/GntR family transcriptional regulator [Paenarthrobacter sp. NyZ202]|uniref:FadR/GntR family transcriptional regulator n=1 Tax=Paenarthrobacter sp. NyZ202 TaxID=3402689 RepID=UPI003CF4F75C
MPAYPGNTAAKMSEALSALPSESNVTQVARRFLEYFASGEIEPGTRLPPERALAASLGIGRSAVREALAALEIMGIVVVKPGSGTYLRGMDSELLPQTLSWGLMLGEPKTRELIEIRRLLECEAARLCATQIDAEGVDRLAGHLAVMKESLDDLEAFVDADLHFHLEIATAAGNTVLLELLQSIRSLLRVWVDRALHDKSGGVLALREHAKVFAAIKKGDADGAAAAMAAHMETAGGRLIKTFDE